ncbi:filamentous hemagglutinin N-terminal domain-containing protein [Candidatus Omnitrophota bacterium]
MSRAKFSRAISLFVAISMLMMPQYGYSLPQGGTVVAGQATINVDGTTMDVNVSTQKMIANWNSFSIGKPETVNFFQPSRSSIALNRVTGADPSSILGRLNATGKIFLINPNGVVFGQGAVVDTAGMVASSLNITDADFLAGRYTFFGQGGSVVNQGYISSPGGYVALLGSSVENSGLIEAQLGSIVLASGSAITLGLDPQGLINVVVDEATISNLEAKDDAVKNMGTITADGGKVVLTAKTLDGVFDKAVNNEGVIEASSLVGKEGQVYLLAKGNNELVSHTGSIDVSAAVAGVDGGFIEISGDRIQISGDVAASSIDGATGHLLIDPLTVTITNASPGDGIDFGPGASTVGEQWLEAQNINTTISADTWVHFALTSDNVLNLVNFDTEFFRVEAGGEIDLGNDSIETAGGDIELYADFAVGGNNALVNDNGQVLWSGYGPGWDAHLSTNGALRDGNIYFSGQDVDLRFNIGATEYEVAIDAGTANVYFSPSTVKPIYMRDTFEVQANNSFVLSQALENIIAAEIVVGNDDGSLVSKAGDIIFWDDYTYDFLSDFDMPTLRLVSGGRIWDNNGATIDVRVDNLRAYAVDGVGDLGGANPLETEINHLYTRASAGDVFINELDGVVIHDAQALGSTVDITTGGETVAKNVEATGTTGDPAEVFLRVVNGGLTVQDDGILANAVGNGSEATIELTTVDGGITVNGTSVRANVEGNGDAKLTMHAENGDITIVNSPNSVRANVDGDGSVEVFLQTEETSGEPQSRDIVLDNASVAATIDGHGDAIVEMLAGTEVIDATATIFEETFTSAGDVTLRNGSNVLAKIGSGYTSAEIVIAGQDISIGTGDENPSSSVIAEVEGDGTASVQLYGVNHYSKQWDSSAESPKGSETIDGATIQVRDDSEVAAKVGTNGGGNGTAEVKMLSGDITVRGLPGESQGSIVQALVFGAGDATVDMRATRDYYAEGDEWFFQGQEGVDWEAEWQNGQIDIGNNSTVLARIQSQFVAPTAKVEMVTGHLNVSGNSTVQAEVEQSGDALVDIEALSQRYIQENEPSGSGPTLELSGVNHIDGGTVSVWDASFIRSIVGSGEGRGSGNADVNIRTGHLSLGQQFLGSGPGNSGIEALVTNTGTASVDITTRGQYLRNLWSVFPNDLNRFSSGWMFNGGSVAVVNNSMIRSDVGTVADGGSGSAKVVLRDARRVNIGTPDSTTDFSGLRAWVHGPGEAKVKIDAVEEHSFNRSDYTGGWSEQERFTREYESSSGHNVNINDNALVLAKIESGVDTAKVMINAGEILVKNATVKAEVEGEGTAKILMDAMMLDWLTTYSGGGLPVPTLMGGNIDIIEGSSVLATVSGYGSAFVLLNTLAVYVDGWSDVLAFLGDVLGGDVSPVGNINVNGSSVRAETQGQEDLGDICDDGLCDAEGAYVGLLSNNIGLTNGDVEAEVFQAGIAAVGLGATNDVSVNAESSVSAVADDGLALVLLAAGNLIDAFGPISATSGGFAGVGLIGVNDVRAWDVSAEGGEDFDLFWLVNSCLLGDVCGVSLEIGAQYEYSSAILVASLIGDVYLGQIGADMVLAAAFGLDELFSPDYTGGTPSGEADIIDREGMVEAKYLGLLARNNIGTLGEPITTDVSILSGYSWDQGGIFIDELNDIELGLYLPIIYAEDSGARAATLGASVAANNGIIAIAANGDILVNSVIAPHGGVLLLSREGSIYAGEGWCPAGFCDAEPNSESTQTSFISGPSLAGLLMDIFLMEGLSAFGGPDYFLPVMASDSFMTLLQSGCESLEGNPYLNPGPNVVAGGKSYFAAPNGTIGVGDPRIGDAPLDLYNPLNVCIQDIDGQSVLPIAGINSAAGLTLNIGGRVPNNTYQDPWGHGFIGIGGAIEGIVRPGVTAITGVFPSPDLQPVQNNPLYPPGYVFYHDMQGECCGLLTPYQQQEPTEVIHLASVSITNGVRGYTLPTQIWPGPHDVPPPPPQTRSIVIPKEPNGFRVYYEILNPSDFRNFEPTTRGSGKIGLYAYHPISEVDESAFDAIALDVGAYEFIDNNLNLNDPLAPYFEEEEEEQAQQ